MNSATRLLIGLGAVGGLGGASYFLQTQLYTDNIEKKLLAEGYKILDDNSEEWDSILKSYIATANKPDNKLKFNNFEVKEGKKETLIKACKGALAKPVSDKDIYEKTKHWCIVSISLETALKNEGFKVLSTKTDDEELDKTAWISKLEDHVKNNKEFENKKFTGVKDIADKEPVKKDKQNIVAIKQECEKLNKKKHYEVDFKENTDKAKLWCSTKSEKGK